MLLDINRPRRSGLACLHELRQDPKLTASIGFVLTPSSRPEDKAAAYDQQVAGYIHKRNVGEDFVNGINCLAAYQALVILPNRS